MRNIFSWLKRSVRKADSFPQTVGLTYKGQGAFQTIYGGLVSLFILVIILSYSVRLFMIMFQKGQTNKTLNTVISDIQNEVIDYNVDRDSFAFTFAPLDLTTGSKLYDPSYINISISQVQRFYNRETGARSAISEDRLFSICKEKFPYISADFKEIRDILKEVNYCADSQNFTIQGGGFNNIMKEVAITVKKCVNGTSVVCQSPTDIENKIKATSFLFGITSQYFDFDDYIRILFFL